MEKYKTNLINYAFLNFIRVSYNEALPCKPIYKNVNLTKAVVD